MKNYILKATLFACSLALLAGCAKELPTPVDNEPAGNETQPTVTRLGLTTEGYTADTKTSVLDNTVVWVDGDCVKIQGPSYNHSFDVSVNGGKAYIDLGDYSELPTLIFASYPSGNDITSFNAQINFPASYTSTIDANGRQVIALPMMAYADNSGSNVQALEFKHQTAAVKVMLWNATTTTLTVTRVVVKTESHKISGVVDTGETHSKNPASDLPVIPNCEYKSMRRVDVNFPGHGETGALTLSAGDQTKSVQVPIYPIGDDQMTIEVYLTDGTFKYVYSYKASNPALARNQMMTAKAKLDLAGHMETVKVNLSSLTGDYEAQNGDILTGTLTGNHQITIADGATVILEDVNITNLGKGAFYAGITCLGDATILLSGSNSVMGGMDDNTQGSGDGIGRWPGIFVPSGKTLTIDGTGSLDARSNGIDVGYKHAPGIGGDWNNPCGNIVIQGGSVTATGGDQSAGIGGTGSGCGNITITGSANVTATGGDDAAGIGSGKNGSCGDITISTTGTVSAQGGCRGAGIGSGWAKDKIIQCGDILISKGTIVATGGEFAAGIGTGYANGSDRNSCGRITIENSVTRVTATKGGSYAFFSIGISNPGNTFCGTITIGGTLYWEDNDYKNDGNTYLRQSPLVYTPGQ